MTESRKEKVKVKWGKVKTFVHDYWFPLFGGMTVGAAWGGYKMGFANAKQINKVSDRLEATVEVVENNARCQQYDRNRLEELQRQQNLLMERALKETEGKAE